jgi:DNA-binding FrmR family transcriptional regulator
LTNTLWGYIIKLKIPIGGIFVEEKKTEVCACHKTKKRDEAEFKKLVNRLNRIEGQIRGIKRMLENDAYCPDILVQAAAVNAAINSFNKELLSSHIHTCVADDIREGKDEVIGLLLFAEYAKNLQKAYQSSTAVVAA